MILSLTTDKIQIVLTGSITTSQLQCMASWVDITSTDTTPGRTLTLTNNTTDVDLIESPAASTQRLVKDIFVFNSDTVSATVIVKIDANGTEMIIQKVTLSPGEILEYNDRSGFATKDSFGRIKTSITENAGVAVINTLNVVTLTGDVTNNNATANTLQDVTGLSFPVIAGQTYYFEFVVPYISAATTTGSRWTLNGPALTMLNGTSEYTLTATTKTLNCFTAYSIPAASSASSLTTGNVMTMWGVITPSANGTVQLQFASEVSSSAITAKSGGMLRWIRLI